MAAAISLKVKDFTMMLTPPGPKPDLYDPLPSKLFPAYLMRGVEKLYIRSAQATTLDPVPNFDVSVFPALKLLVFEQLDPVALLASTAATLHFLPESEQFNKVFNICSLLGLKFATPGQGYAAEIAVARELSTAFGGPIRLLQVAASRLHKMLDNQEAAEMAVFALTFLLCQFAREKILGVGPDVTIFVKYTSPTWPSIDVRKPNPPAIVSYAY